MTDRFAIGVSPTAFLSIVTSAHGRALMFSDAFGGWPYLLKYGLRAQDPKMTLDKASDFIDLWKDEHADDGPTDSAANGRRRCMLDLEHRRHEFGRPPSRGGPKLARGLGPPGRLPNGPMF